jgi:hypothetical protein
MDPQVQMALASRAQLDRARAAATAALFTGAKIVIGSVYPAQAGDLAAKLQAALKDAVPAAILDFKQVSTASGGCVPVLRCSVDRITDKSKIDYHIELASKYPDDHLVVMIDVDAVVATDFADKLKSVWQSFETGAKLVAQVGLGGKADSIFLAARAGISALSVLKDLRKQVSNKWLTHVLQKREGVTLVDLTKPRDDGAGLQPVVLSI